MTDQITVAAKLLSTGVADHTRNAAGTVSDIRYQHEPNGLNSAVTRCSISALALCGRNVSGRDK